jgi:hypothetical protein
MAIEIKDAECKDLESGRLRHGARPNLACTTWLEAP